MNNTQNRVLDSIFDGRISLHGGYTCGMEKVSYEKKLDTDTLLLDPLAVAREFIINIFYDFNWRNPSEQMIQTHQENLVNRRL